MLILQTILQIIQSHTDYPLIQRDYYTPTRQTIPKENHIQYTLSPKRSIYPDVLRLCWNKNLDTETLLYIEISESEISISLYGIFNTRIQFTMTHINDPHLERHIINTLKTAIDRAIKRDELKAKSLKDYYHHKRQYERSLKHAF